MKFLVLENVTVPLGPHTVIQDNGAAGVYVYLGGTRFTASESYEDVLEVIDELGFL